VLEKPYYIRHYPKNEDDKHFVEPSLHTMGHKLSGFGDKNLAQVYVKKEDGVHNDLFTKKSKLFYKYQRIGHIIS
jgi:hypothetical protein